MRQFIKYARVSSACRAVRRMRTICSFIATVRPSSPSSVSRPPTEPATCLGRCATPKATLTGSREARNAIETVTALGAYSVSSELQLGSRRQDAASGYRMLTLDADRFIANRPRKVLRFLARRGLGCVSVSQQRLANDAFGMRLRGVVEHRQLANRAPHQKLEKER
jgi:hypothetical protein